MEKHLPLSLDRVGLDRAILRLALPAAGASLLRALFSLTDAWWCGQVGSAQLAAYGTASFFVWGLMAVSLAASVGLAARVARSTGAREATAAGLAARDGLGAALLVASVTGGLLFLFAPELVAFQGGEDEVAREATAYLRALALGAPAYFAHDAADAALRGRGDTRTPAIAGVVAVLVNLALDPLVLFGFGPIPPLGVGGVGMVTVLTQAGTALFLWQVVRWRGGLARGRPGWEGIGRTVRIGAPSAALGLGFSLVYVAITPSVAAFGTAQLAALTLGHRSESIAYMVSVGFAAAAQALVGQYLGAGRPDLARLAARRTAMMAGAFTGIFSLLLVAFSAQFAGFFSSQPEVVAAGALYLAIVGWSLAPQTVETVLTGAFEGAGDTVPPMVLGAVAHGMRLPLVHLCTAVLGLGVASVWGVIAGCSLAAGVGMVVLFRRRGPGADTGRAPPSPDEPYSRVSV